jgi:hypothetical protein
MHGRTPRTDANKAHAVTDHRTRDELFRAAVIATAAILLCIAGWWLYRWMYPPVAYYYLLPYPPRP